MTDAAATGYKTDQRILKFAPGAHEMRTNILDPAMISRRWTKPAPENHDVNIAALSKSGFSVGGWRVAMRDRVVLPTGRRYPIRKVPKDSLLAAALRFDEIITECLKGEAQRREAERRRAQAAAAARLARRRKPRWKEVRSIAQLKQQKGVN